MDETKYPKFPIRVVVIVACILIGVLLLARNFLVRRIPASVPADVRQQIKQLWSNNPRERMFAAHELGKMGPQAIAAVPFLLNMLGDDAHPGKFIIEDYAGSPGAEAALALAKIGTVPLEKLLAALRERDKIVRKHAAIALGEIGDPRAIQPLIVTLEDKDMWVRKQANRALAKVGKPVVVPLIAALAKLPVKDGIFFDAARTLGQIDDPDLVKLLIALLKSEDAHLREAGAIALGGREDVRGVEPLVAALRDEQWRVRMYAAEALGRIRDGNTVLPLVAVLKDAHPSVQWKAAAALGDIGDSRAVEPLISALDDERGIVRKAAAIALGRLKDPRAFEPLMAALGDDADVCDAVAVALGRLKDPRAVDPLVNLLIKDRWWNVRMGAAQALGEIGDYRAVKPLIAALDDRNPEVRQQAFFALKRITGKQFNQDAAVWWKWWQENHTHKTKEEVQRQRVMD